MGLFLAGLKIFQENYTFWSFSRELCVKYDIYWNLISKGAVQLNCSLTLGFPLYLSYINDIYSYHILSSLNWRIYHPTRIAVKSVMLLRCFRMTELNWINRVSYLFVIFLLLRNIVNNFLTPERHSFTDTYNALPYLQYAVWSIHTFTLCGYEPAFFLWLQYDGTREYI